MTVQEFTLLGTESLRASKGTHVYYVQPWNYDLHKRILDILVASVCLVVFLIPMLVIAIVIKATSKGPVLYRQERHGQNGVIFKIWKFRTMTCAESGDEFKQAVAGDSRVTKFGSFLRAKSLDELPNLINVLTGEMSIVGPRPHVRQLETQFTEVCERYNKRNKVKPGITGLAQVSGHRGPTDTYEQVYGRINCDNKYVDQCSLALDIKIILRTAKVVLKDPTAF